MYSMNSSLYCKKQIKVQLHMVGRQRPERGDAFMVKENTIKINIVLFRDADLKQSLQLCDVISDI